MKTHQMMIIIGLCLHQIHTHRKDYKMQNLYWTDKNELDIIDRNNNEEIEQAENFYKVGQEKGNNKTYQCEHPLPAGRYHSSLSISYFVEYWQ